LVHVITYAVKGYECSEAAAGLSALIVIAVGVSDARKWRGR
jgi:hypothetical protein